MKTYTLLTISVIIMLFSSCASTNKFIPFQRTGEVTFVEHSTEGTILLNSVGYAANKNEGVLYAERNAFENLFFKGVPGSSQKSPMIDDEEKAIYGHRGFFEGFFKSGEYRKYIIESILIDERKSPNGIVITQEIKIDINSLRKLLEKEQIVRKFGF